MNQEKYDYRYGLPSYEEYVKDMKRAEAIQFFKYLHVQQEQLFNKLWRFKHDIADLRLVGCFDTVQVIRCDKTLPIQLQKTSA